MCAATNDKLKTVIPSQDIQARIKELGRELSERYGDEPVLCICVLKGAFMFFSDLVKSLSCPVEVDFVRLASYGDSTSSSGKVRFTKDLDESVEGRHVLIIEDIVDSGHSMEFFKHVLLKRDPKSLAICAFIDKHERRAVDLTVDFYGFRLEKGFLVGYGLDYAERYRELDAVYELLSTD